MVCCRPVSALVVWEWKPGALGFFSAASLAFQVRFDLNHRWYKFVVATGDDTASSDSYHKCLGGGAKPVGCHLWHQVPEFIFTMWSEVL